jgi:hypothetical protein
LFDPDPQAAPVAATVAAPATRTKSRLVKTPLPIEELGSGIEEQVLEPHGEPGAPAPDPKPAAGDGAPLADPLGEAPSVGNERGGEADVAAHGPFPVPVASAAQKAGDPSGGVGQRVAGFVDVDVEGHGRELGTSPSTGKGPPMSADPNLARPPGCQSFGGRRSFDTLPLR